MSEFVKKVQSKISKLSTEQLELLFDSINSKNSMFSSIIESLSTGLVIVDTKWRIFQKNKAADRLLFLNRRIYDLSENLFVWELVEDENIADFLKSCCDENKTNLSEEFSISNGEKIQFVTISVLPLVTRLEENSNSMEIEGSIITIDDITEKRKQEIILHRMESLASLTNLAASVAHEIKNPLGAISIHIQLLQKTIKKAREKDGLLPQPKFLENYLDVVNEEIENLNKIVLDFLFAVRPVQADMELIECDSLIKRTVDFFIPEFESKNIKVETDFNCEKLRLLIDEKLFKEVLVNLFQNAIAAMKEKNGILSVKTYAKNEKYILSIKDNGCGMTEDVSSRIFEPYYTTKADGTGLGLTKVYKVIKEFRGDITVKSDVGKGTVFYIAIPVPQKNTMLLADNSEAQK
ncbi:MAG: ATP-binding protein [Treponema sp.]|nr:ATP-binding protein [Spirochaetales bacterium]MDY4901622.1 ATP-binding protein [Treponema sp.]